MMSIAWICSSRPLPTFCGCWRKRKCGLVDAVTHEIRRRREGKEVRFTFVCCICPLAIVTCPGLEATDLVAISSGLYRGGCLSGRSHHDRRGRGACVGVEDWKASDGHGLGGLGRSRLHRGPSVRIHHSWACRRSRTWLWRRPCPACCPTGTWTSHHAGQVSDLATECLDLGS